MKAAISVCLHAITLLVVLYLLPDAFDKRFDCLSSSQRDTTATHETAVLDRDLECVTNAGKSSVSDGHGEATQALCKLWRAKDLTEGVTFLVDANTLDWCVVILLGEELQRLGKRTEQLVESALVCRFKER